MTRHHPIPRSALLPDATIADPPNPTGSTASFVTASTKDRALLDYDATTATHYQTLGVTADASQQDIRRAFRALALRYHPDRSARRRNRQLEEPGMGDGAGRATGVITGVTNHPPLPWGSGSGSGTAPRNFGTDGVEADMDVTWDDADGSEQLQSEGSLSSSVTSEDGSLTAVTSVDDDDTDKGQSYEDEDEDEDLCEGGEEDGALSFRRIREAYMVLRCDESRESYDARLRREAARRDQRTAAAASALCSTAVTRVALSEMDCEVCEVVSSPSDGEDDRDGDGATDRERRRFADSDEVELEKVYTYPCRCGDGIEVMESELLPLTSTPMTTDVRFNPSPFSLNDGRTGPGGFGAGAACSTSAVFQCRSCSLSVWIDLAS